MALTALQILKLLPQTNCGECGFPTCLAFALKLAAKSVELAECPHATQEAKDTLGAAAAPPIRPIKIGVGDFSVKIGEETVMFRHDKTFYNPTGIAPVITDDLDDNNLSKKLGYIKNMSTERAGVRLNIAIVGLKSVSGDVDKFTRLVKIFIDNMNLPFILMGESASLMEKPLDTCANKRPIVYCAHENNLDQMVRVAVDYKVPLVLRTNGDLSQLADLTSKAKDMGLEDIVIDPGSRNLYEQLTHQTLIRRCAIQKSFRPLGYPTVSYVTDTGNPYNDSLSIILGICKYSSLVITERFQDWQLLPLLTLRANIFTDPQKPLQINPGIYKVGDPGPESPVFVTTNFSLTYFIVSGEIESADTPSYMVLVDAEGMSVLTAWSAGKFTGEIVGESVKNSGIENQVTHRKLIIPGYVAVIRGELEDALPQWEIMVGPQEASGIPKYLKEYW